MLNYVKENFGNRPSVNEAERMELDYLRSEVARLRAEVYGANQPAAGESTAEDKYGDDSSSGSGGSEEEGEYVDNLPVKIANSAPKGPR